MAQHIGIITLNNTNLEVKSKINFADIYNNIPYNSLLLYYNRINPYEDVVFENMEIKYLICDLDKLLNDFPDIILIKDILSLLINSKKVIFIGD